MGEIWFILAPVSTQLHHFGPTGGFSHTHRNILIIKNVNGPVNTTGFAINMKDQSGVILQFWGGPVHLSTVLLGISHRWGRPVGDSGTKLVLSYGLKERSSEQITLKSIILFWTTLLFYKLFLIEALNNYVHFTILQVYRTTFPLSLL